MKASSRPLLATPLLTFAFLAIAPALPLQGAALQQAEITRIYNQVSVIAPGGAPKPAEVSETIRGSQAVQTGVQSRAELKFTDQTLTRLGANTVFSFNQGTRDMELNSGTMLLQVPKSAGGAEIRTASVTAAVTGTTVLVEYTTNPNGYAKFTVLEGTMRLFLKDRPGESILLQPGDMVIMRPNAMRIPDPVKIDLKKLVATSGLLEGFDETGNEEELTEAVREQETEIRDGQLIDTNVIILGKGNRAHIASDELLTLLDERFQQGETRIERAIPVVPPGPPIPDELIKEGIPPVIDSDPYIVNATTEVITDPIITTNGVSDFGTIFNPAVEPISSIFITSSPVDSLLTLDMNSPFQDAFALFRFQSLVLDGGFAVDTFEGPTKLVFVGINAIDVISDVDLSGTLLDSFGLFADAGPLTINAGAGIFMNSGQNLALLSRNGDLNVDGDLVAGSISVLGNQQMEIGSLNSTISTPLFSGRSIGGQLYNGRFIVGEFMALSEAGRINFIGAGSIDRAQLFGPEVRFAPGEGTAQSLTLNNLLIDASNRIEVRSAGSHDLGMVVLDAPQIAFNGNTPFAPDTLTLITETLPSSTIGLAPTNFFLQAPSVTGDINGIPLDYSRVQNIDLQLLGLTASTDFLVPLDGKNFRLRLGSEGIQADGTQLGDFTQVGVLPGGDIRARALFTQNLVVEGGNLYLDSLNADMVNVNGAAIVQRIRGFSTNPTSFNFTGPVAMTGNQGIGVGSASFTASELNLANGSLMAGNVTITNRDLWGKANVDVNNLSVAGAINLDGNLRAQNSINANFIDVGGIIQIGSSLTSNIGVNADSIQPVSGTTGPYTITSPTLVLPNGLAFSGTDGSPGGNGPTVQLNMQSFLTGTGTGQVSGATVQGGDDTVGSNPGAGGSLLVNASNTIQVGFGTVIDARPGSPATTVPASGKGGRIRLQSQNGAINVSGSVQASDSMSDVGGIIELIANNSASVTLASTGALNAALSASGTGPSGRVMVEVNSGTAEINGSINAANGQVVVQNNANMGGGGIPSIDIQNNASITADIVKIGALATEGVLQVQAGSTITGNSQVTLYGGANPGGAINFVGAGNVNINSALTIMRANAVNVDMGTTVNVGGFFGAPDTIKIFADQRNFSIPGHGNIQLNGDVIPNTIGSGSFTGGDYQVGSYNDGSAYPF